MKISDFMAVQWANPLIQRAFCLCVVVGWATWLAPPSQIGPPDHVFLRWCHGVVVGVPISGSGVYGREEPHQE
jgi:hypothetical protein